MSFTEYEGGEGEDFAFDLNDISSFLYSIGYLNKQKFHNIQKNKNSLKNFEIFFEENQNITVTDTSVKYGTLLTEINKFFNTKSSFEEHFQQYRAYTKSSINFTTYLNYLILLVYILKKYDDILNINSLLNIDNQKISIIELDSQDNFFNSKLDKLYNDLHDKNIYNEKEINPNLIILIFILSLNDLLTINTQDNNINNLITKFSLYNKIYVSNIDLGLLLYIEFSVLLQVYSSSKEQNKQEGNKIFNKIEKINIGENQIRNKRKNDSMKSDNIFEKLKKPFTSRYFEKNKKNNNKTEIGGEIIKTEYAINNTNYNRINYINENNNEISILNDLSHIPNLYLFDNDNIKFPNNPHIVIFIFQSYLKLISFYELSQHNISLLVNLTINSLFAFREEFDANKNKNNEIKDGKKENSNEVNIKDYYSLKNYNNYDFYIFKYVDKKSLKNIRIDNISLFNNNNIISLCFKNIYLNEFLIKIGCFDDEKLIEQIFNTYLEIIKKSNMFYIQELQFLSHTILDNLSISDLHLQYNIIFYILELFSKIVKKTNPKILSFKFNTFKININRDIRNIQLYFDFSKIKEKTIFDYIIKNQKMIILYNKYENIINNLRDIKNYESKIRLLQSNFRSHQVNFLFSLIIKKLVDYVDDIKTSRISILESKFNNFNPNMKVYIKNEKKKRKARLEEIRHMIQEFPLNHKIRMLNNYIAHLEQNFDLIMLSDNFTKDFRLIRKCDENQIYFFITKEKKKINLLEKEKQIEDKKFGSTGNLPNLSNKNNNQSTQGNNNFLNIIFYIKNDSNSFIYIINFLESLIDDEQCELQNNITIICDRFYLESYVIMEPSLKSLVKRLFPIIDNYYVIAKKSKSKKDDEGKDNDDNNDNDNDDFNYDIYIADEFIAVQNYHQYNNKINNYSELIYEFLTSMSGCIEFIIYTLRTKDIYLEKFYYIIRNMSDKYYFFEYKNSNIFIKQIKDFDSLIFFNEKKANPLLCLLPKIPESEYTMSIDNFYELYLRLFLNLNKVEEQKEKLSQIFLYKIHKNIFYENYESIILIAYSYNAFNVFNDFFLKNNFLSTTKEKFKNVHFFPFDAKGNNNSYIKILENQKNNTLVANNIYIYEYGFNSNFKFSKQNLFFLSYKKSEYLLDKTKELINNKNFVQDREEKKLLFKILKNKKVKKESIKQVINNIILFWKRNDKINIYHLSSSDYENVLKNYQKNVYQIQTQKVDMRLQNLTEDAINNYNNLKNKQKNCLIY